MEQKHFVNVMGVYLNINLLTEDYSWNSQTFYVSFLCIYLFLIY